MPRVHESEAGDIRLEAFTYLSRIDQWPIQAYSWPVDGARATIVIAHGMAEHARRYERLIVQLNRAGLNVLAMDHRAHGQTSGPGGLGDFGVGGWDALVADLDLRLIEPLLAVCR